MILVKNTLFEDRVTGAVVRLLAELTSGRANDNESTHVVVIDINAPHAMPQVVGKTKLLERIANLELKSIHEQSDSINLAALTPSENAVVERRWSLIQNLIAHGDLLYDESFRGQETKRLVIAKIASKPFFYKTLQLYWQRGGGKTSLVSNFPNCGRPGERRVATSGAPKPGRPRTVQPGVGVAATEFHRANMRIAWSRSPVGTTGKGLESAYSWMLITRYPDHVSIETGKKKQKVVLSNYDSVPTFEQFQYHWKAEHSYELRQLNRMQRRRFDLAFKPLLTGTMKEVRGPGTRYYIDATVLDVYCVSRLNRNRIVGRPTLYVVVDQFSRMIVGMYVGLEPPCWAGAMLALWNCSIDKVAFCAKYNVDISAESWPTAYMPVHLMGDRGELTSAQADALSAGFAIDVENSRPYAGEAKGVAERVFGTLQTKFGPYLPGYVDKEFLGRGAEPPALRSAMDVFEITRAMVLAVLHTNLRVVRDYEGWPEVVAAGVPFIPVELWNWGAKNLRCDARQYDESHLMRYLWPRGKTKLNRKALHLTRGLFYMGVDLASQPWFAKSFIERRELEVAYHPLEMTTAVVIRDEDRVATYQVELTQRCNRFKGFSLSEVMALQGHADRTNATAQWENQPTQASLEKQILETVKEARRRSAEQVDKSLSKAERLAAIRDNKADEIGAMTADVMSTFTGGEISDGAARVERQVLSVEEDQTIIAVRQLIENQARRRKAIT